MLYVIDPKYFLRDLDSFGMRPALYLSAMKWNSGHPQRFLRGLYRRMGLSFTPNIIA